MQCIESITRFRCPYQAHPSGSARSGVWMVGCSGGPGLPVAGDAESVLEGVQRAGAPAPVTVDATVPAEQLVTIGEVDPATGTVLLEMNSAASTCRVYRERESDLRIPLRRP